MYHPLSDEKPARKPAAPTKKRIQNFKKIKKKSKIKFTAIIID